MTLRIKSTPQGGSTILLLSGRLRAETLEELRRHVARSGPLGAFDLDEVTLVDLASVRYLASAEREGIELRNCPPFIREWISRERAFASGVPANRDPLP